MDPLAGKFAEHSPYNYVLGNPISLVDPDGRAPSTWPPSWAEGWNNFKTSVQKAFYSLGLDSETIFGGPKTAQRAMNVEDNRKALGIVQEGYEDVTDVMGLIVPGAGLVDPRSTDSDIAIEGAVEIGGAFLPGLKFVDKAKTVVKKSDEVVEFTQGFGENVQKIIASIPEGFKKIKQKIKGQKIFSNGKTYISPDADGHIGGTWKAAKSVKELGSKKTRLGTYNDNLERIGD